MAQRPGTPRYSVSTRATFAGIAGITASLWTQPLEMIRVRLQLSQQPCSVRRTLQLVVEREGVRALYIGTTAALLRQATNTTTRIALLNYQLEEFQRTYKRKPQVTERLGMSVSAAVAGAVVGTPTELVWIRRMADGGRMQLGIKHICQPRYTGTVNAFRKIYRTDGIPGLWHSGTLVISRAVMVSTVHVISYALIRDQLKIRQLAEGKKLHVFPLFGSITLSSVVTYPIDVVKVRYQEMKVDRTISEVARDCYRIGFRVWRGYPMYCAKMTLHAFVALFTLNTLFDEYDCLYYPDK